MWLASAPHDPHLPAMMLINALFFNPADDKNAGHFSLLGILP
jgi:hypothetical protein